MVAQVSIVRTLVLPGLLTGTVVFAALLGGCTTNPEGTAARGGSPVVMDASTERPAPVSLPTGDASPGNVTVDAPRDAPATAPHGGPSPPCRFRFCEGFETTAAGEAPDPGLWKRTGDVVVGTTRAARGTKALQIRTGAAPTESYISQSKTLPTLGNAFWGRVYFFVQQRPHEFYHWNLFEVRGPDAFGPTARYGGISSTPRFPCKPNYDCRNNFGFHLKPRVYGADEGTGTADNLDPLIADGTWHCVEWYMNGARREARLWWNGEERPAFTYLDKRPMFAFPAFHRFYLGWALYQKHPGGLGWEVWVDELALHDERIGCEG